MKKFCSIFLVLLLICGIFCGCGAANDEAAMEAYTSGAYSYSYAQAGGNVEFYAMDDGYVMAPEAEPVATETVSSNRKLIRTVSLTVETEDYDQLMAQINGLVTSCGGYIETMEANTRYSSNNRYAYLTIRVRADRLDEFSGEIGSVSNVVSRSESSRDITTSYVDTESRRNALSIEQDRLLALLEKAESLSEILEIESRLTDVRYELENMESQLRSYDNQVEYATVNLNVEEVKVFTEVEEKGFWEKLGDGFLDSVNGLWEILKNIFSFLVISLPYLIPLVFLPLAVLLVLLHRRRKRRAKNNKTEE